MVMLASTYVRHKFWSLFDRALQRCLRNWNDAFDVDSEVTYARYGSVQGFLSALEADGGSFYSQYKETRKGGQGRVARTLTREAFEKFKEKIFDRWLDDALLRENLYSYHETYLYLESIGEKLQPTARGADVVEELLAGESLRGLSRDRKLLTNWITRHTCGAHDTLIVPDGPRNARAIIREIWTKPAVFGLSGIDEFEEVWGEALLCASTTSIDHNSHEDGEIYSDLAKHFAHMRETKFADAIAYMTSAQQRMAALTAFNGNKEYLTKLVVTTQNAALRSNSLYNNDLRVAGSLLVVKTHATLGMFGLKFGDYGYTYDDGKRPVFGEVWEAISLTDTREVMDIGPEILGQSLVARAYVQRKNGDSSKSVDFTLYALDALTSKGVRKYSVWCDWYANLADICSDVGDYLSKAAALARIEQILAAVGATGRAAEAGANSDSTIFEGTKMSRRSTLKNRRLREILAETPPPLQ